MRNVLIAVSAMAAPIAPAAAQGAPAPGVFTAEEAAWCAVVFAKGAEAMRGLPETPSRLREQFEVGAMVWRYELIAAAPGQEEFLQRTALAALDRLNEEMPQGADEAAANARGEFLVSRAGGCTERIQQVYTEGPHPIVQQLAVLREEDAKRQSAPAAPPATRKPGLR